MSLFKESQELKDFRQVFRKFVAREITPHVEEWEATGRCPASFGRRWEPRGFSVRGCLKNMEART